MDTIDSVIIYAILFFSLIFGFVSIFMLSRIKKSQGSGETSKELDAKLSGIVREVAEEFARNRNFTQNDQKILRDELDKKMTAISGNLSDMTKYNLENQLKLSELLKNSLENIRDKNIEQNERQTRLMNDSISKMIENNEKKLEEMRKTVDEKLTSTLTTRLDSSFKTVSEQLENLYKSLGEMKELSSGVTDNVKALNSVLTNVKSRGTWAEVQLENILDQTIPGMYVKNYKSSEVDGQVEFAVKIPSNEDSARFIYLPIDSKFPMEDYIRLCSASESGDAAQTEIARKALEQRVLQDAKKITKYINIPYTTNFAIMYLATEGLYAEVITSKNGLCEKIQNEYNIMIAGPTTISALLNSLAMGFRAVAINEKANDIRQLLGAIKKQYDNFAELLAKAKRNIETAGKTLDDAEKRNNIIQKKLKDVEALDGEEATLVLSE